jgi:hypothetical protein
MYRLINANVDRLLAEIDRTDDVKRYEWLLKEVWNRNVARDSEFQREYCKYWGLNAARLANQFRAAYFRYLEEHKNDPNLSVEAVASHLYDVASHRGGRRCLQFAFSTKLVHTLRPDKPIYDSMVEDFFFLPSGPEKETVDAKLERLLASYRFLVNEYLRVLQQRLLADAISGFHEHFQVGPGYSDYKVIDALIWGFVTFLRSGAVRNGDVVFG